MSVKLERNDVCWCGSGKKYKMCHFNLDERVQSYKRRGCIVPGRKMIKSSSQINGIRDCGKVNIELLDYITDYIQQGISTQEINRLIDTKTRALGGIPATLGYEGFPKSVCISINNVVCHGIPSEMVILRDGDILNIDVTTQVNGFYSDSSRMYGVGRVSDARKRLVETTRKAIDMGLEHARPWNFLGDIGQAINDFARVNGYSVVKEIGGHGVGMEVHEAPFVSHVSKKGTEMLLVPGMIFTIEPMINMGKSDVVIDEKDGWTIRTMDGQDSAQWEVTVLITDRGHEILAY